jgi:squalene-hopene/tetraprenyl-beta-curcumene cyclase
MANARNTQRIDDALTRTRNYVLSSQTTDGTWVGAVQSDVRPTAFYLNTLWNLGRDPDDETREMELYLSSEQLGCGAWEAFPGGGPDTDVTAVCTFALKKAQTAQGRRARSSAQDWLAGRSPPNADSFWKGFLALNGHLDWADLPYLTPRLVSNPDWLHPNIYDFSFVRIAVVCASLMQTRQTEGQGATSPGHVAEEEETPTFAEWKRRWIAEARKPLRGFLPILCGLLRKLDRAGSIDRHVGIAAKWLLDHQERDGSFFSSVHMTSIAISTLHQLNAHQYHEQIEAGLSAMRQWQVRDGGVRSQQFTDATNWHTFLCLDLLQRLGAPASARQVQRARNYTIASQGVHHGDWSHRTRDHSAGGWGFQRIGKWYPDNDDTAMAITALLHLEDDACVPVIRRGLRWLLAMQSSNGGWASWDRNDRSWIRIPNGGPWFARDLASPEITARVLIVLSRVIQGKCKGCNDLIPVAQSALNRGMRWLRRSKQNGIWFGRWFTHYLYGTCLVLEAYRDLGHACNHPEFEVARQWLISAANPDGGFGEATNSGSRNEFVGAASTPFHTACGLLGLVHVGAADLPVAERAATWLLDNQNADGSWTNRDFFAAGVPGLWYANFALTPTYFAAKSLLSWRTA